MKIVTAAATVLFATSAFAAGALAQSSPAGNPSDPNTLENQQPGPSAKNPTDPAAGSKPSARVPSAKPGVGGADTGASSGESGTADYPAGNPADPNTPQNQQPGPGMKNPTDPAAGAKPSARVPTDPQKQ